MDIAHKVAIVTGAAGGIGAAIARRFVERGGSVVLADVLAAPLEELADQLNEIQTGSAVGSQADVSAESDLARLIAQAEHRFGSVDIFFANAGVGLGTGLASTEDEWRAAIDVNVLAHVRAARLLVPAWAERGSGYFFSTASAAGLLTQVGSPTYSVTKHGAVAFAEWLAVTYGPRGVAVSCLCPMGVNTSMLAEALHSPDDQARAGARAVTRAGSVLEPLEVADVVIEAVGDERFLVLPHPEVLDFFRGKGADYDRWIAGMQRYQKQLMA